MSTKKKKIDGKKKGNAEERKVARELSVWMFEDKHVLKRSADSGATKVVWCGDVVPVKQIPDIWNKKFPFIIEVKSGYTKHAPDYWKNTQLAKWFIKAYEEGQVHNQNIVFLCTQFLNRTALLSTNYLLPFIPYSVCFPILLPDEQWIQVYVYKLKEVLQIDFHKMFNIEALTKDPDF